jgi:hypothetical protein
MFLARSGVVTQPSAPFTTGADKYLIVTPFGFAVPDVIQRSRHQISQTFAQRYPPTLASAPDPSGMETA